MAKKPTRLTPGGGSTGAPVHRHHRHPHTGGPITPGGGGTGAPAKRAPKAKHHPKARHHPKAKRHPKRKLAGTPLGGGWILGGNDTADNCALVAAANALLAATGCRTPDAEILRLWNRDGPLSIPEALEELGARFTEFQPGGEAPWSSVAGLVTPHGPHAALILGGQIVTWGGILELPDDWEVEECWAVAW